MATRMTRVSVEIPNSQPMVALLGASDEYLHIVEKAFPDVDILVRGNVINLEGDSPSVDTVETLVSEMLARMLSAVVECPRAKCRNNKKRMTGVSL